MRCSLIHKFSSGILCVAMLALISGCSGMSQTHEEATRILKEGHNQNVADLLAQSANQDFMVGNLDQALSNINGAVNYMPNNDQHYVMKGRILIEMNRLEHALTTLNQAILLNPDNPDAHYYAGLIYQRWSQTDNACAEYRKAYDIDSTSSDYLVAVLEMMVDTKMFDEAMDLVKANNEHFDNNATIKRIMGHIELMRNNPDNAASYFHQAMLLVPEDKSVAEDYIIALFISQQYAQAQYELEKIINEQDYAQRTDIHKLYAMCLLNNNRLIEARLQYMKITEMSSTDVESWIDLGTINYTLQDYKGMNRVASKLVNFWPERYEGYVLRGLLAETQGDYQNAANDYKLAATLTTDCEYPEMLFANIINRYDFEYVSDTQSDNYNMHKTISNKTTEHTASADMQGIKSQE